MADSHPAPNPGMFQGRRISKIPNRVEHKSNPTHAFTGNTSQRGQSDSQALVDTGILIAAGSATGINGVKKFADRYEGRIFTTRAVHEEVVNRSTSTDPSKSLVTKSAKVAKEYLLNSGRVKVRQVNVVTSAALLQQIQDQLNALEQARGVANSMPGGNYVKHAGEATLITLAVAEKIYTLLTNDAGASLVAASQKPAVRPLHFGDVLRELVCASEPPIDPHVASSTFATACTISGLVEGAKPSDTIHYFSCQRTASGMCEACS